MKTPHINQAVWSRRPARGWLLYDGAAIAWAEGAYTPKMREREGDGPNRAVLFSGIGAALIALVGGASFLLG